MIEIQNLSFGYPKKELLYDEINMNMPEGHIYGLLGKNGAGKTTLLKLLTGLRFPEKGQVNIDSFEPKYRQSEYLQKVFFIPEEFYLPKYSRKKYEETYSPFYRAFQHDKFNEYLHLFGITESCKLDSLSLGQKKKFILAFAFATNCQFLFLDEPTNGLDIPSKKHFRKIASEWIDHHRTIVISTHQVHDVTNLLDRVIILDEGKILLNETLEKLEKCLTMKLHQNEKNIPNSIYSQYVIGGRVSLEKNKTNQSNDIDLELLFNAAMYNSDAILDAIKDGME
ncbi:MAG: ABC transporter ATP-binding protein [Caldisericia bacterium]|nr:ABC transporter ATP-binding protein [Caldisericia bacterium]MDD4615169.1 ABC transporter ATP-binding protein [Caldisericia bacterium]